MKTSKSIANSAIEKHTSKLSQLIKLRDKLVKERAALVEMLRALGGVGVLLLCLF